MSACLVVDLPSHAKATQLRVSIVMLTYNRPQFISRAINSILNQEFQHWELIVVHDGPNEQIAEIMTQWSQRDSRIRYLRRPNGGNIANATNYALKHARGEYIAILDDDDYWIYRHKLTKQIQFLDERPDYVACGGGMTVVDQHGHECSRYFKPEDDAHIKRWALVANPIAHSTSMFRRSVIEQCGRYDESLKGFQDWDVCLKLGRHGKLYNFPEQFTGYTMWDGGGSFVQHKTNTRSALTIVTRHAGAYRGFPLAILLAGIQHVYAYLPGSIRQFSFSFLSRAKKALFSERKKELMPAAEDVPYEGITT